MISIFLLLNSIPLRIYTTFSLSIHQLKDVQFASIPSVLWTQWLWTWLSKYLWNRMLRPFGRSLFSVLIIHHTDFYSSCTMFAISPAVNEGSLPPTSSPAFVVNYFINLSHSRSGNIVRENILLCYSWEVSRQLLNITSRHCTLLGSRFNCFLIFPRYE